MSNLCVKVVTQEKVIIVSDLFEAFKNLVFKQEVPDEKLLVPVLRWLSGSEENITMCQEINKKFYHGNRKVFILEATLSNNIKRFIRYPTVPKDDPKLSFFYNDIAKYFGWSSRELRKNISVLKIDELKPVIARAFGYNNKQRKDVGVGTIEGVPNGAGHRNQTRQIRTTAVKGRNNRGGTQKSLKGYTTKAVKSKAFIVNQVQS